ncbi:alanine/glycine:cation symporter family protein [Thalassolituus marinus]|uniref:Sodium:alanine symporter family protein n=1 Tax=Thalassolituus marinus TaxID=671053 RepID=A0ABS7ZYS4_9GAMM|nr:sodium:alanine symporter family protein [Thalassolituus marinus]MCA6065510.1 sodium:alanine symporter family protein [Thalassolituus marinus]
MLDFINTINGLAWGAPMLLLIGLTGLYLTLGLKAYPVRNIGRGFSYLWKNRHGRGDGEISGFNALMTSLSATIGTGNIAGVATAIAAGGPGAVFWMWVIALVGMATKYSEAVLAVHFREKNAEGHFVGGPMYYIRNGLGSKFTWLAVLFAFFGMFAGFGIGNGVQANSVADALHGGFGIPEWATGVGIAVLVGLVLLGGIRRISEVAGKLVPFMAIAYVLGGIVLLIIFADRVPAAIALIVEHAFTPVSAAGGFAGATVWAAIRFGVARGVFSNEAGLGSAPIAHAAAQTDSPVRQGSIAMLGTFIDTIVICSITGIVIVASGAWQLCPDTVSECVAGAGLSGASLTSAAFAAGLPGIGSYIVTLGLAVFAFTTIIGWSFYGEKCTEFLFGVKSVPVFRVIWVLAIPVGATYQLDVAWLIADTLNALMALPNLIALLLLSPVVFKLTKSFLTHGSEPSSK